jgi:chemotaxis protein methyltransferase CheR
MTLLSPQLFAIMSALVERELGIHFGPGDAQLFSEKITARAHEAAFESVLDYYYFLRYDPGAATELEGLAEALVVGETYFFRELAELRASVEHVLAPAVERRGRARVWSAACATGEEPLSIAMLLHEAGIGDRTEIIATDVSARAIARAREGHYSGRSLRALPPEAHAAGLTSSLEAVAERSLVRKPNCAQASAALVASIDYRQLNLVDGNAIAALGTFDLVLCRNVLIYFSDATIVQVAASLAAALADGGRLLIGASESLLRFGTALQCEEHGGAFFYRQAAR